MPRVPSSRLSLCTLLAAAVLACLLLSASACMCFTADCRRAISAEVLLLLADATVAAILQNLVDIERWFALWLQHCIAAHYSATSSTDASS